MTNDFDKGRGKPDVKIEVLSSENLEDEALYIMKILNRFGSTRIVGGWIRDKLFQRIHGDRSVIKEGDIDFATEIPPEKVVEIANEHKIKVKCLGIKYGTVTMIISGKAYEITTLRRDEGCYGRAADVSFYSSWEEDASRRDFTMNALSLDAKYRLFDYHNGIEDIKAKKVVFIGSAEARIKEDYLRILRWFRFVSYIGGELDEKYLDIMSRHSSGLVLLSAERVWSEVKKILATEGGERVFYHMLPILRHLGLRSELGDCEAISRLNFLPSEPVINLGACLNIMHGENEEARLKNANDLAFMWKLSKSEKEVLLKACLDPSCDFSDNRDCETEAFLHPEKYRILLLRLFVEKKFDKKRLDELLKYLCVKREMPLKFSDISFLRLTKEDRGKAVAFAKKEWVKSNFSYSKEALIFKVRCNFSRVE